MKTNINRIISAVLAVIIAVCLLAGFAMADENEVKEFPDVDAAAWYGEAVYQMCGLGVIKGYPDGRFRPDRTATKANAVTILWRYSGSPESDAEPDADESSYYYGAAKWAVELGAVDAVSTDKRLSEACTRADFVFYLWLMSGKEASSLPDPFSDIAESPYRDAIVWAFENDVAHGVGSGRFRPENECSRAEIVTFLSRLEAGHRHEFDVSARIEGDNPCEEREKRTFTCAECGYSAETKTRAKGHSFELSRTVEPKGENAGYREYLCPVCGKSYREEIPAECVILHDVEYINQNKWPTGCESVSTVAALRYAGYDISVDSFIDNYLPRGPMIYYKNGKKYGADPAESFVGNPRSSSGGYGCYASAIVKALKKYLGSGDKYLDLTGAELADLAENYVRNGIPVIVWATSGMKKPYLRTSWTATDTGRVIKWYSPFHCLLLVGFDKDYYYFNDPQAGKEVKYARSTSEDRFNFMGKQAIAILPANH